MLINNASSDPRFQDHPGLHLYGIESYIAVPLNRRDGSYFGTLCALDPDPAQMTEDDYDVFHLLSNLISFELEAEEQHRRREAEMQAMEDFIAIAAHDLRQPLTVLQGRSQMLERSIRKGAATDDLLRGVNEIAAQARRAVLLSEAVLDVARIETGGLILQGSTFDLQALACESVADIRTIAPRHSFAFAEAAPVLFHGDERRMGQVLRNLLENAVKYVPPQCGPVEISVTRHATDGEAAIVVEVRDHGPGVTDADLPRLFERKYRSPEAQTGPRSGSGLGLFIARQIVDAHHGRIWSEHAPGGGLLVKIVLPVA